MAELEILWNTPMAEVSFGTAMTTIWLISFFASLITQ